LGLLESSAELFHRNPEQWHECRKARRRLALPAALDKNAA
jgi:hypothetical protein